MADRKYSADTELAVEPAVGDAFVIRDVSDVTDGAGGTMKQFLWSTLKAIFAVAAKGVTGGDAHDHAGGDGAAIVEAAITLADNATLDASTTKHGLAPKLVAPAATLMNFLGLTNAETALTNKPLFDATHPENLGTAAEGSQLIASRRDHVHQITPDVVGDAGAGGTKGLVPAPGAGDTAAGKYLKADATWSVPAGAGVKLDDATAPDDNTDLNASTTAHGLLLKATAPAATLMNVVGLVNAETAYTNKPLFDATHPEDIGAAAEGTQLIAARRDHVHALPDALVTYAKMQHVSATDKVLGRSTAGAGDVEEIACTAAGRAILDDANAAAQLATLGAMPDAVETVTYAKMQHVSATDKLLGRSTAGAGDVEEIACTAAGRAILDDANAAAQLATLGAAPTASPTFTGTMTVPKTLEIQDTSADHQYVLAVSELTADRIVTLPLLTDTDFFVFAAFIQTLTNKRITSRVGTVASHATPTPTADDSDLYTVTAQAEAAAFAAPSGTPTNGQKLIIRIKDNATARALSWNAIYRALGVALPTTTTISKTLYVGFIYNSTDSKWDCVAKTEEA
jgi:hypothetical protein